MLLQFPRNGRPDFVNDNNSWLKTLCLDKNTFGGTTSSKPCERNNNRLLVSYEDWVEDQDRNWTTCKVNDSLF
jgi:hypothetical protein